MNWQGVNVTVVTNKPDLAAEYLFLLPLAYVPRWANIISTARDIMAIPNGARAVGFWIGDSYLREIWREHRATIRLSSEEPSAWAVMSAYCKWRRHGAPLQPDIISQPPAPSATQPPPPPQAVEPSKPKQPRWK